MKITKVEVKTLYDVDVQFKDFSSIFSKAKEDDLRLNKEFEGFNLSDTSIGNVRNCFRSLDRCEDIQYIARKLGFDGVENFGYYNERKGVYTFTVYDNGDTLGDDNYRMER